MPRKLPIKSKPKAVPIDAHAFETLNINQIINLRFNVFGADPVGFANRWLRAGKGYPAKEFDGIYL